MPTSLWELCMMRMLLSSSLNNLSNVFYRIGKSSSHQRVYKETSCPFIKKNVAILFQNCHEGRSKFSLWYSV